MQPHMDFTGDNTPDLIEAAEERSADRQRQEVLEDIQRTFGVVPGFFKMMPPTHLVHEWKVFKDFEFGSDTALPPKVKELIALAVASVLHCKYCTYFHTLVAGMHQASPEEINEALLMAKHTAGWSTYLTGARYDMEQLKEELAAVQRHLAPH